MKTRPDGFLKDLFSAPPTEVSEYISELHDYLWRFVRAELPFANGQLNEYLDVAIEQVEHKQKKEQK